MAAANVDSCEICTNGFNAGRRQSVLLPCGHSFCLSCLIQLKASGKTKCPTCRGNWTDFEVNALPGMEALATALEPDHEDEADMAKKEVGVFDRCEKHSMPYDYWVTGTIEFFCRRCAAENRQVDIQLIEDVLPRIKDTLADVAPVALKNVEHNLKSLEEMNSLFVKRRNSIQEFMKALMSLDDKFKQNLEQIEATKSQEMNTAADIKRMQKKIGGIESLSDINLALECKSTLVRGVGPLTLPDLDITETLLCNIACSYMKEAATETPPSPTSFAVAVLKSRLNIVQPRPSLDKLLAADELKEVVKTGAKDDTFVSMKVNYNTYRTVLVALAQEQLSGLDLLETYDAPDNLPLATLASTARGCDINAKFVDTFYAAKNTAIDGIRLQQLAANQSLRLTVFFGHLDQLTTARLPQTITHLGLAIGSAVEAAAVSSIRPWRALKTLNVSVRTDVPIEDLHPLPSVAEKQLTFPLLSGDDVGRVRPAIEALVPDMRVRDLYFPKSAMSLKSSDLADQLRGVVVTNEVTIELNFAMYVSATQQKQEGDALRRHTRCKAVKWSMVW